MNRVPLAVIAGLIGFAVYICAALAGADLVLRLHWTVQAIYFLVAGSAWVLPARWLMYWSVHQR